MPIETVQQALDKIDSGFKKRWENNPDFRRKLEGKDRDIVIDLGPDGAYHLVVRDGYLQEIRDERPADQDALVTTTKDALLDIFNGDLHPIKAYTMGHVKVKASFRDVLLVRAFLGG